MRSGGKLDEKCKRDLEENSRRTGGELEENGRRRQGIGEQTENWRRIGGELMEGGELGEKGGRRGGDFPRRPRGRTYHDQHKGGHSTVLAASSRARIRAASAVMPSVGIRRHEEDEEAEGRAASRSTTPAVARQVVPPLPASTATPLL